VYQSCRVQFHSAGQAAVKASCGGGPDDAAHRARRNASEEQEHMIADSLLMPDNTLR
jgi:hypothetical protein